MSGLEPHDLQPHKVFPIPHMAISATMTERQLCCSLGVRWDPLCFFEFRPRPGTTLQTTAVLPGVPHKNVAPPHPNARLHLDSYVNTGQQLSKASRTQSPLTQAPVHSVPHHGTSVCFAHACTTWGVVVLCFTWGSQLLGQNA